MRVQPTKVALTRCCGASRWVDGMMAAAPFASADHLHATAERLWWALSDDDWREAFTHHPKIGDVDQLREKFAQTAAWSEGEQAGVNTASDATLQALADGNARYEARFGFIFIVCATGKSAAQMLALLHGRIDNPPPAELLIAAAEQRKITRIRLDKLLAEET